MQDYPNPTDEVTQVGVNTHVVVQLIAGTEGVETMEFDLVRAKSADIDAGFLGDTSPLAKAILGQSVGATMAYTMGDITAVRIVAISQRHAVPPDDTATQRQAKLEEAVRKAERTNAEMFASSYGSKWGGYEISDGEED